jgi:hypothetical protein
VRAACWACRTASANRGSASASARASSGSATSRVTALSQEGSSDESSGGDGVWTELLTAFRRSDPPREIAVAFSCMADCRDWWDSVAVQEALWDTVLAAGRAAGRRRGLARVRHGRGQ